MGLSCPPSMPHKLFFNKQAFCFILYQQNYFNMNNIFIKILSILMTNGSILELTSKGNLDCELTNNKSSIFNFDINNKKNKYSKLDKLYFPHGKSSWNTTSRFYIKHDGDLLYGLYLKIKLPKLSIKYLNTSPIQNEYDSTSAYRVKYADFIGNVIIKKISLYINDSLIDESDGTYMQIYNDLCVADWNRKLMIGLDGNLNNPKLKIDSEYIYIPLKFWFCDNLKPLPIIAIKSNIYIDVTFRDFNECIQVLEEHDSILYHSNITHQLFQIEEVALQANFYLVEAKERIELASRDYEFIITQSQVRSVEFNHNVSLNINFNHVIKDLFFFIQPISNKTNGDFFNYTAKSTYIQSELKSTISTDTNSYKLWNLEPKQHLLSQARILFNGIERVGWRDYKYYYLMQNFENFKNIMYSHCYMYSFNAEPVRNNNLSGCNFSKIDNAQLQINMKSNPFIIKESPLVTYPVDKLYNLVCYTTNFNVFVIKNGITGIKYN